MAAKRFFDDSDHDNPDDNNKRIRTTPRPSFASYVVVSIYIHPYIYLYLEHT